MITDQIRSRVLPGMIIPKPEAAADFTVKGWQSRRGEEALVYLIPNHRNAAKPYEKGITVSEFTAAYNELMRSGKLTRRWFGANLPDCAKEGGCNFTTVGGVFELLGIAEYVGRGTYSRRR